MKYVIGPIGRLPFRWRESHMTGQIDPDGNNAPNWKDVLSPWVQVLPKRARTMFDVEGTLGAKIADQDLSAMNEGRMLLLRAKALRPDCQFGIAFFPSSSDVYLPEDIERDMDRAENQYTHMIQYADFTCQHIYLDSDHNFRYLDHNLNVTSNTGPFMPVDFVWFHRYTETDARSPLARVPKVILQEWLNFVYVHHKSAGYPLPNWHLWFAGMMSFMRYSTLHPANYEEGGSTPDPFMPPAIRAAFAQWNRRYWLTAGGGFNAELAYTDAQAELQEVIGWANEVI